MIAFIAIFYSFTFSPSSPFYAPKSSRSHFARPQAHIHNPGYAPASWGGDGLKNRIFFTFMFIEMVSWFWVWVTLREERKEVLSRKSQRRRSSHSSSYNKY